MIATFVDTSAFVALVNKRDRNHGQARRFLKSAAKRRIPLVTSEYVADEVITLVRMRVNHPAAVTAGAAIFNSKWCRLLDVDRPIRARAWELFVRFDDHEFSFTDCTSFALMHSLELRDAFTFDRADFAAAGFVAVPA